MQKSMGKRNHERMIVWQMADLLDCYTQKILRGIPRTEFKLRSQIDSASDSIGSNLVEGYYSGSTREFIRFCRYSRRSCGELQERVRRCVRKGYISQDDYTRFCRIVIRTGYLFDRLIMSLGEREAISKVIR
jgi:four helix bundle protein